MPNPNNEHATLEEDVSLEAMDDPNRIKSPRELAMERMEAEHLRRSQLEAGLPVEEPAPAPAAKPAPAPKDEEDDQLAMQLAGDDVIADPAGKKVRVKVDGIEQDVSLDEVLRSYQKGSAADRRLEEATRLLREAQKAAAAAQQPAPAAEEPAATPSSAGPEALVDPVKNALRKLYVGDEEAAAQDLAEVIARNAAGAATPQPTVDPVQLVAQVQEQMAFQSALGRVTSDYPDLLASKDLEQLTFIKAKAYVQEGKPRADALLAAADDVYSLIGKKSGRQEEPAPKTLRQEKQERKAALDPVPAASVAAGSGPSEEEEQSPSAVIAAMAKRRLGQSLPPGR